MVYGRLNFPLGKACAVKGGRAEWNWISPPSLAMICVGP